MLSFLHINVGCYCQVNFRDLVEYVSTCASKDIGRGGMARSQKKTSLNTSVSLKLSFVTILISLLTGNIFELELSSDKTKDNRICLWGDRKI